MSKGEAPDKQPWFKFRRSWLMAARKLKNVNECQDFFSALEAFADGLDYTAKTDRVDMIIDDMREFLSYGRKSYENMQKGGRKSEPGKEGSLKKEKGKERNETPENEGEKKEGTRKKEIGKERSAFSTDGVNAKNILENQAFSENPLKALLTGLDKEKEKENENENEIPPPTPVLAGLASGGEGFKFLYFLGQYERLTASASSWVLPSGCDELQRDRAAWVCTDQTKQPEVMNAIQANDKEALLRATKGPTARTISRELWRLCEAVASVTAQQLANIGGCNGLEGFRQAVAHEVNTARMGSEGTAVFKTMLNKIDYIKQGNKVGSLSAFLAARGGR